MPTNKDKMWMAVIAIIGSLTILVCTLSYIKFTAELKMMAIVVLGMLIFLIGVSQLRDKIRGIE